MVFLTQIGDVAQMVERSLSMREAPGSMPGFSTFFLLWPLANGLSFGTHNKNACQRFHSIFIFWFLSSYTVYFSTACHGRLHILMGHVIHA
jgi:hypothetical protein